MRALVLSIALTVPAAAEPKITSQTTPLSSKLCKKLPKPYNGHPSVTCPAPAGYAVTMSFVSNEYTQVYISDELAELQIGGKKVGDTIEWRFADGKPFAVIVASDRWLRVRSLERGFIGDIDGDTPDALKRARAAADASLSPSKKKKSSR